MRRLFDFATTESGEMALVKDELVELVQKDANGWFLVRKNGVEGWAPNNYLQEVAPPPKPRAPPPRPAAPPKPAAAAVGGLRLANGASAASSGRASPALAPKPSIPSKPGAGANGSASAARGPPAAPGGQMDLAAALAQRLQQRSQ